MFESKTQMLKKGTIIYDSDIGYYGIHYPNTKKTYTVSHDAIIVKINWLGPKGLTAIKISTSFVEELVNVNRKHIIMWTKEENIESY